LCFLYFLWLPNLVAAGDASLVRSRLNVARDSFRNSLIEN